ncbi:Porin OmpN [Yokenella regensburgei]|nr:Porin OmpN [Yokenella regensburgei]
MLPEFGGDSYTKSDNFMTGRTNGVATYRNNDFFGLVDGLKFALQYQGKNENPGSGEGTNNGNRSFRNANGDGFGVSSTYDIGEGFSVGAGYTTSNRTNDQKNANLGNQQYTGGNKAEAWTAGAKYDANNVYIATMYAETRNMTPYGSTDSANQGGIADKTQNFEITAQYQFDFGLRPAISYLQSKGKGLNTFGGDSDKDLVKYVDLGATYYFNKNMSTYVDYKINLLDGNDDFYKNNGIGTDNIVALGLVYQF